MAHGHTLPTDSTASPALRATSRRPALLLELAAKLGLWILWTRSERSDHTGYGVLKFVQPRISVFRLPILIWMIMAELLRELTQLIVHSGRFHLQPEKGAELVGVEMQIVPQDSKQARPKSLKIGKVLVNRFACSDVPGECEFIGIANISHRSAPIGCEKL